MAVGPGEVMIVAMVFVGGGTVLFPIARALGKKIEGSDDARPAMPADMTHRLERIERAVEAVAVEVERISEGQRFVTQVMSDRNNKLPSLGAGPQ